ncbi:hypothetical protein RD110_10595 [Rhodoferax koreense]|uniref:NadR/Ttd14 AAA domain-containing protein n=1 Tax=Rhodoferax koreensis TaxID=1842727 RepID=A0A1P8JUZ6_9BURK|nr:ATP-binding protein [Rhodoferax koreense]APW37577.1 hypothetical protein RD110_10595 [Rhodoferax koreense]
MSDVVTIALLGTESTGKTWLTQAMSRALAARGHRVATVAEWLRTWCDQHGRTPRPDEQAGIAQTQASHVRQAVAQLAGEPSASPGFVIADTTPLMTAIYSDWLFGDDSLYAMALAHQQTYIHTLVTGLDLPWVADGLQRDGPQVRAPIDALLRGKLAQGDVPYKVIYGSGDERLHNALQACQLLPSPASRDPASPEAGAERWVWTCDKCSDPACEHRLFSRLTKPPAS